MITGTLITSFIFGLLSPPLLNQSFYYPTQLHLQMKLLSKTRCGADRGSSPKKKRNGASNQRAGRRLEKRFVETFQPSPLFGALVINLACLCRFFITFHDFLAASNKLTEK